MRWISVLLLTLALCQLIEDVEGRRLISRRKITRRRLRDALEDPLHEQAQQCSCKDKALKRLRREITNISFKNCEVINGKSTLKFSNISLSPTPLIAPGDLFLSFSMDLDSFLPPDVQVDVDMYRYVFGLPLWIPCTELVLGKGTSVNIGSCSHKDICSMVESDACPSLRRNSIPCSCNDLKPGRYDVTRPFAFIMPNMNQIIDILVQGEYLFRAEFVDRSTQEAFGCIEGSWKISKLHRKKAAKLYKVKRKRSILEHLQSSYS